MKRDYLILCLLSLLLVVSNVVWLNLDTRPPSWDASVHLNLTYQYGDILRAFKPSFLKEIIAVSGYYPPLFHVMATPFFTFFGPSLSAALCTNIFFLFLLVFSTYFIGRHLYNGTVGCLSAFFVSVYPFVIYMSRTLVLDLALTSMVALGFLLYLESKDFAKRNFSILFGVVCGLGMLVKWTYAFFLLGPIVYGFWMLFFRKNALGPAKVHFIMSALSAFFIAVPWYSYNLIKFIRYSIRFSDIGSSEGDPAVLTLSSILYYAKNLLFQIQPVFFVLFLIAFFLYLLHFSKQNKVLFWWLVIPYVILTFISNKDERYTLPFLPVVSIISSFWLASLNSMKIRKIVITLAVVFGVGQFLVTSFASVPYYYCQPPHHENWQQEEALAFINQSKEKEFATVSVVSNHSYWHSESIRFCARRLGLPLLFNGFGRDLGQFADFVITKSGDLGPSFTLGEIPAARGEMLDEKSNFRRHFMLVKTYTLPDSSELFVFKRKRFTYGAKRFDDKIFVEKLLNALMGSFREFQDLAVEAQAENIEQAQAGIFKRIVLSAARLKVKDLWLDKVKVVFKDIELDLPLLWEQEKLKIFAIREIEPSCVISAEELMKLLRAKAKKIQDASVIVQNDTLLVKGKLQGLRFEVLAKVFHQENFLMADFRELRYGMCNIPSWFYEGILEKPLSLIPTAEWPVRTSINAIELENDKITLNPHFALERTCRRGYRKKKCNAKFGITSANMRKSRRDFLSRPYGQILQSGLK